MKDKSNKSEWLVVTQDGLFLTHGLGLSAEYPNARLFARRWMGQSTALEARIQGPYSVMSTDEYAAEALS